MSASKKSPAKKKSATRRSKPRLGADAPAARTSLASAAGNVAPEGGRQYMTLASGTVVRKVHYHVPPGVAQAIAVEAAMRSCAASTVATELLQEALAARAKGRKS